MATTTNYGWTTPDDTALVKDGAAAIRTLGSSVDTTTKNLNPETTLGDIVYRSSTANVKTRLGIGTTGQVLTVAAGVPSWATPAAGGGGKVLQVVQGTTTTSTLVNSATFTATTLTANITPTLNTSKILILVNQAIYSYTNVANKIGGGIQLLRDSTEIYTISNTQNGGTVQAVGASGIEVLGMGNLMYLDSPATTSAITYSTKGRPSATGSGQHSTYQFDNSASSIILLEIGA